MEEELDIINGIIRKTEENANGKFQFGCVKVKIYNN